MPALAGAARMLKKELPEAAILGLSMDGSRAESKEEALKETQHTIARLGLPYKNLVWLGPTEPLIEKIKLAGTPYNVLLSAEGQVLGEVEILEHRDEAIADLVKRFTDALAKLKTGTPAAEVKPPANPEKK